MRVLTVDDNPIIRAGLCAVLGASPTVGQVLETGDPDEAVRLVESGEADAVLLDVQIPRVSGLELLPSLVAHVPVIMLTHDENAETLAEAMAAGALGYVVHGSLDPEGLVDALRMCVQGSTVVAGARPAWGGGTSGGVRHERVALTQREREVMEAIALGMTNREIAASLFLTEKTVKNNINRIFAKLQVASRGAAIARWRGLGSG
ncbi:response regulator transcription factor [Microbacterium sp. NPDC096154]|uniref:response regulator transcription factor n=1 Tax=Microbacterium sp. NPDC096154 TaxID=3155549 RepID=UPI0033170B8B